MYKYTRIYTFLKSVSHGGDKGEGLIFLCMGVYMCILGTMVAGTYSVGQESPVFDCAMATNL